VGIGSVGIASVGFGSVGAGRAGVGRVGGVATTSGATRIGPPDPVGSAVMAEPAARAGAVVGTAVVVEVEVVEAVVRIRLVRG